MLKILRERLRQRHRTMAYPSGPPPDMPALFAGLPEIVAGQCLSGCSECVAACPTGAVSVPTEKEGPRIDMGRCLFCRDCEGACPRNVIHFSADYQLAAARREDLVVKAGPADRRCMRHELASSLFGRSLKLRQVSAGGCGACEADCNVLGTVAWDIGRFGVQFVASPRHADGLLITGPVTENMILALEKTFTAVPSPKVVVAVGACALSGGVFRGHPEQRNGVSLAGAVDLFVPGCPPHPLTVLDGLLRFLGRI